MTGEGHAAKLHQQTAKTQTKTNKPSFFKAL